MYRIIRYLNIGVAKLNKYNISINNLLCIFISHFFSECLWVYLFTKISNVINIV